VECAGYTVHRRSTVGAEAGAAGRLERSGQAVEDPGLSGWSRQRFEDWLRATLTESLLPPTG
jgi:hypothetical protein